MSAQYRCSECGAAYPIEPTRMVCDPCSAAQLPDEPLRGVLDVWRPRPAPEGQPFDGIVAPADFVPVPVGNTPLCRLPGLAARLGGPRLYLKFEAGNLTGSLKDSASRLVGAFARRHRIGNNGLASTGNAGSSIAGIGAAGGL